MWAFLRPFNQILKDKGIPWFPPCYLRVRDQGGRFDWGGPTPRPLMEDKWHEWPLSQRRRTLEIRDHCVGLDLMLLTTHQLSTTLSAPPQSDCWAIVSISARHFQISNALMRLVAFSLRSLAIGFLSSILGPCPPQPNEKMSQKRHPEEGEPSNLWLGAFPLQSPMYGLLCASVFSLNTWVIFLKNL